MTDGDPKASAPLLKGVSQFDVDFVIPRMGVDIPVGIDPFLLFKSRDPTFAEMHHLLLRHVATGVMAVNEGRYGDARTILDFPEVREVGLGYAKGSKRGSGIGEYLGRLMIDTLRNSPTLRERGVRHLEEFQLLSVGIGPDRISDIAANILKASLISYTQRQCELWSLELQAAVPVGHVLDPETFEWVDRYFDLPVSPFDGSPIILVPRRIVRSLPWINYPDYVSMEFAAYLRAKGTKRRGASGAPAKEEVVAVSRKEIERVDRYIARKEASAEAAQPSSEYLRGGNVSAEGTKLEGALTGLSAGLENANAYQRLVLEILNFLFSPELIDGRLEQRTVDGTERRDIVFTNDSDMTFWSYLRTEHSSFLLMFEVKNKTSITNQDVAQTATYLGDRLGRLGVIITRAPVAMPQCRKAYSVYNDSTPRKVILFVSDEDLRLMLRTRCEGSEPMRHLQKLYRAFRISVQ